MINVKGFELSNVVISTIFGHAGRGMFPYYFYPSYQRLLSLALQTNTSILTKSSTAEPKKGNYRKWNPATWKYVQTLPNEGILNAYGLTNDGVKVIAPQIKRSVNNCFNVIPNFYPEFSKGKDVATAETINAITCFYHYLGNDFRAIEISYSCPNSKEDIASNMEQANSCTAEIKKRFPNLILIVKISYVHPYEFSQEQERLGADIIHAVNTIPFDLVYPGERSPLHEVKGGGGVSGRPSCQMTFEYSKQLARKIHIPIIMGNGVMSVCEANRRFDAGASAISICTAIKHNPTGAVDIIEFFNQ